MKNIFKLLAVFVASGLLFASCEKITYFEENSHAPDANASFYLQFINAAKTAETGVSLDGGLIEVESSIAVVLMGVPQTQDITVSLAVDASSNFDASMYTLSANSITIPAGKTSGSVDFSTVAENMPVGETLKFVLNLNAGENANPNPKALQLTYNIKRIEFCPLVNGVADLVGTWSGEDAWYSSMITTAVSGNSTLAVSGMSEGFIEDWWGEAVIAGGTFNMTITPNGNVDIPRQYIYTTDWKGTPYRYEILGSGKWTNCGPEPTMLIIYDIYYEGDASGLAKTYASYLDNIPYFTADITLSGVKRAFVTPTTLVLPTFKK